MEITWNVKDCNNSLNYAVNTISRGEYKASCSVAKMSLPEKIAAYRKIQPVFNEIRGIRKQIEGAYGLDKDTVAYVQDNLHRELAAVVLKHFDIAPKGIRNMNHHADSFK